MPAPINVELRGYLDFFGLKNGGMNPQMPAAFLQPAMDLQRWYMESRVLELHAAAANRVANAGAQAVNFTSTAPVDLVVGGTLRVPQNEVWVVLPGSKMQWTFSAVAGQFFDAQFSFSQGVVQNFPPSADLVGFQSSDAASTIAGSRTIQEPYWLSPGAIVQYFMMRCVVPSLNITPQASLRLVRLRV